ncbi:MAG: hypothetical protein IPJ34_40250 [Myxococcales bacterium]|nr:hypothetical protein [Myxococcales bacterium]
MKKQSGKPTFSISADGETQRILEQEAARSHGVTNPQRALFLDEVDGKNKPRKPRRTA